MLNAVSPIVEVQAAKTFAEPGEYLVNLAFFSGPMDLLLHLVRQQEVSVEHVEMRKVTEQYLSIISRAHCLDLDLASEYLVIAATLVDLKSQSVLPRATIVDEDDLESRDPAFLEELRERIRQYELTKKRAEQLRALPQLGFESFVRIDRKALAPDPETVGEGPGDALDLGKMFYQLLKRIGDGVPRLFIRMETVSIVSFMMKVLGCLEPLIPSMGDRAGGSKFCDIFSDIFRKENIAAADPSTRQLHIRHVLIGAFISTLELVKRGLVQVSTSGDGRDFTVAPALAGAGATSFDTLESEFDEAPQSTVMGSAPIAVSHPDVIDMNEYRATRLKHEEADGSDERREVNRNV